MKFLFVFITSCLFITCISKEKADDMEQNVFLIETANNFDTNGVMIENNSAETIHFSKDFWDFFIKKFQMSAGMIFFFSLNQNYPDYYKFKDTSLTFFDVDFFHD